MGRCRTYRGFIGTYTREERAGIYHCRFDDGTGKFVRTGMSESRTNPSYLTAHPQRDAIYAVSEVSDGALTAFSLNRKAGTVEVINEVVTGGGADPCYCTIDPTGSCIITAHYTSGRVTLHPLLEGGRIGERADLVTHVGGGPVRQRQESAHPHCVAFSPVSRTVYVPDLGIDQVICYDLDLDSMQLNRSEQGSVHVPDGSGPRHIAFHPSRNRAYLMNELASTVITLSEDPSRGELQLIDCVDSVPSTYTGKNAGGEIQVHPSGKWVYASNRGHDSIATFDIDEETGVATLKGWTATNGEWPRHFTILPCGEYLFAENQYSDTISVFEIEQESGELRPSGEEISVPSPVCLIFP